MSEWKEYPLEEVVDRFIDYRGKTPTKTASGVPLITAKIVKGGFIQKPEEFIAESDYDAWMRRGLPKMGDVVLTTEAPLGEVAQIETDEKVALAQRIITLRGKEKILDNTFLRYSLQGNTMQSRLTGRASGSTVQGIKSSELKKVLIPLPEIGEQQSIAEILSSLDEKIELNCKQSRTLEAIAQALFKRWFVEFEFPDENGRPYKSSGGAMQPSELGEIPVEWDVKPLSTLVDINSWTLSAKDDLEYIDYIEISEVNRGDINQISTYQRGLEPSRARRRLKHGDSAISTVRPDRGAYFLALNPEEHLIASTGFAVLTGRLIPWSLVQAFITQDSVSTELGRLADGGAYPAVRPEVIGGFPMVVPKTGRLLDHFHAICSSLYEKADYNRKASKSLGMTRDTLLPKLMSGELRVA